MKFNSIVIFLILLFLLLLTACNLPFSSSGSPSSGKGIAISFKESPRDGSTIGEQDKFAVSLDVQNYIQSDKDISGYLCLTDLASDTYGGIPSNECRYIDLQPAEKANNNVCAGQPAEPIRFPAQGFYQYHNLDVFSQQNQLLINFVYQSSMSASATSCVSSPQSTSLSISSNCKGLQTASVQQQYAPIQVSKVTVDTGTDSPPYDIRLKYEITLSKTEDGTLFIPTGDLANAGQIEAVKFQAYVNRFPLVCQGLQNNMVVFKTNQNEKVIKCAMSLKLDQEIANANLDVLMDYGFRKVIKGPKFNLKKEEAYVA